MRRIAVAVVAALGLLGGTAHVAGEGGGAGGGIERLEKVRARLGPLHGPLGETRPGDWLERHPEPGQTFAAYVRSNPRRPTAKRRVIVIQPLGDLGREERDVIERASEYIGLVYGLPVRIEGALPLSVIPAEARRVHPSWGVEQILSTYVLDEVLKPRLPDDAAAAIAFTGTDLWPGEGWNFVFGQASLSERVGVFSIYRSGDPAEGAAAFRLCLLRTMKTGVHEVGHMFSMRHCTAHPCVMCGSNHREESDRRPVHLCPECVCKALWLSGADPVERCRALARFCRREGLAEQARFFERSAAALAQGGGAN